MSTFFAALNFFPIYALRISTQTITEMGFQAILFNLTSVRIEAEERIRCREGSIDYSAYATQKQKESVKQFARQLVAVGKLVRQV